MSKSITNRVNESFDSADKESLKFYLGSLTAAWKDRADGIRRSATLMVILIIVFELLLRGSLKQVTVGPLVLSGTAIIAVFMPTGVAYFYFEAFRNTIAFEDTGHVYTATFRKWNESAEKNDLDLILEPQTPAFFPAGRGSSFLSSGGRVADIIDNVVAVIAIFGTLAFEGYAFYQLYGDSHVSRILLWINLALSVLLLFSTLLRWLTWS